MHVLYRYSDLVLVTILHDIYCIELCYSVCCGFWEGLGSVAFVRLPHCSMIIVDYEGLLFACVNMLRCMNLNPNPSQRPQYTPVT